MSANPKSVVVERTTHRYAVRLDPDPRATSQRHFTSRLGAELWAAEVAERYAVPIDNRVTERKAGHG